MASVHQLGEVGTWQALGSSRRGEGDQAGGRKDRRVLLALGQTDCGGGGGGYRVESPELPTITDHARIPPLGVTPPMLTTLAVVPLIGD